eukprot:3639037-Pyramimonas_sp.AAC.1
MFQLLTFLGGHLRVDVRGHDAVVVEVVEVVAGLCGDADLRQELDHTPADPPRDDDAHGVAVVGRQLCGVLLVRTNHRRGV